MAKKIDFTETLKKELEDNEIKEPIKTDMFVIKSNNVKIEKTKFLVTVEKDKLQSLDKIAKKNKISRNELINQFINYIIETK